MKANLSGILRNLSLEQRLVAVNAAVFLVIGVIAVVMMTETFTVPAEPPMPLIEQTLQQIGNDGGRKSSEQSQAKYSNFGQKDIFPTIIPTPTVPPTPPPTPPPDPSLEEAIKQWNIKGIVKGIVFIEDPRTREEFFMDMDDPATLTKTVRHKNEDVVVKLDSINEITFEATFSYTGRNGKQEVTRGMFDE
ncbi:MAG: hypothetical protein PWP23_781 [Candidatus Sumerlaeota bacterium]|nr:hypothetical protein [Candidatus Sumerlaeota bacterium]